jgi:hypothetical protein
MSNDFDYFHFSTDQSSRKPFTCSLVQRNLADKFARTPPSSARDFWSTLFARSYKRRLTCGTCPRSPQDKDHFRRHKKCAASSVECFSEANHAPRAQFSLYLSLRQVAAYQMSVVNGLRPRS